MRASEAELTMKGLCAGSLDTSMGEVPREKVPLRAGAEEQLASSEIHWENDQPGDNCFCSQKRTQHCQAACDYRQQDCAHFHGQADYCRTKGWG